MKILFVLEHFYPYIGGAEKLFYVLTTELVKMEYEVVVVTTRYEKKLPKKEIHKGVKIFRINCWNRFAFTFFSLPEVLKHAKNAQLIHTTTYNAALPAVLAGRICNRPVYVTFHEVWGKLWKKLPFTSFIQKNGFYYFEKILLRLPFEKYVAVSEFTKNELMKYGIPCNKIVRVYNGINYSAFENYKHTPGQVFTFTYFGRLGISKGLDILLPAAAKFRQLIPDAKFKLIIPKQPKNLYKKITGLINEYKLDSYIELKHSLPRKILYRELLNSSCVVIPSYSEGFCFAAAETVALKIPIITSQKGALAEVVSGKFIKFEKMEIDSLTSALLEAYNNNWTKTSIRHFYLKNTIKEYIKLYTEKII